MTYDFWRTAAQLQSLAWTLPLVILCFVVVWELRKNAWSAIKHKVHSQMDWVILGIALSFIGKIVESLWWFLPWTLDYIEHPAWADLNSAGVFINIIFRQAFFTVAAYCHLRAFVSPHQSQNLRLIHWILITSILLGQAYPIILYTAKIQ